MPLRIVNANIVLPGEIARNSCLTAEDGVIAGIGRDWPGCRAHGALDVLDAQGAYLMPGMIDIHSDQIEQAIEPRAGTVVDIAYAIQEQEKQLVGQGITTMFQSLSMWKPTGTAGRRKAAREDGFFRRIVDEITSPDSPPRLINHLLHIRFDVTNVEAVPSLAELIGSGRVSLLSFMDHTPGQGQYRDVGRFAAFMKENNPGMGDAEIRERLEKRMMAERVPRERLVEAAALARGMGISVASHDDDSEQKVDFVRDMLGAEISEFPVDIGVARYAKKRGMATLGGAPNVLNGKSHSGNMSAIEGVLDGSIAMLCSDYYPPAMLQAVFKLNRTFRVPLCDCVRLVTLAPAEAVGIDGETGSIEEGKAADLILVDASGEYPRLVAAVVNGSVASTLNYANASRRAPRGVPQGVARSVAQGTLRGVRRSVAQGMPQGVSRSASQGMAQGVLQGVPRSVAQGALQGVPHGVAREAPQDVLQSVPRGVARGMPQGMAQGAPQGILREAPQSVAQGVASLAPSIAIGRAT